jgi:MYXO-CTERM domain-containing protein
VGLAAAALGSPVHVAQAHPLGQAVAWPLIPYDVGIVVDREYRFEWNDSNYITPTGTISIDWFYTRNIPPTFQLGATPPELEGTPIVLGVDEQDRTDAFTWDTSSVAPGSYWIWSRVNDLPGEVTLRINAFSRGVVTVAHPGDPVYPAIILATPPSPFVIVETGSYDVAYEAFDPDGTGRVMLEAMRTRTGTDAFVIAQDLPAARSATITWDVRALPEGNWILRATLVDARGLRAQAYARFLVTIEHPTTADAGRPDARATPDAGPEDIGTYDGGDRPVLEVESCGCSSAGVAPPRLVLGVLCMGVVLLARRRRHGASDRESEAYAG